MKHLKYAGRFCYKSKAPGVTSAEQSGHGCAVRFIIIIIIITTTIIIIIIITDCSKTSRRVALCYVNSDTVQNSSLSGYKGSGNIHFDKNARDNGRFILIYFDDTSRLIFVFYNFPRAEFCWGLAQSYRKLRYLRHYVETICSVLRKTFGPKWGEVKGGCRKLHKEKFRGVSLSPNITRMIQSRRMRWTGHVARMEGGDGEMDRCWWGGVRTRREKIVTPAKIEPRSLARFCSS